jgi:hypothetical protein
MEVRMKNATRVCALVCLAVSSGAPALAQGAAAGAPPSMVVIYREEVRPGKAAAHAANEAAWAAAFTKADAPIRWLAMTTVAGPNEAWFLSAQESWEALQKQEDTMNASAALTADQDRFSSQDGEYLSRTSSLVAAYRPNISYQSGVKLPEMRYMMVDVVRVKPGHIREFVESWRGIIAAHEKAKMDEHWAVYQVVAGDRDGTFLFMYPMKSLTEMDKAGPMHSDGAYRDAVGEGGRVRQNEVTIAAVESSQRLVFRMDPKMSLLTKAWTDADPFWVPKPAPVPAVAAKRADAAKKAADKQ